MTSRRLLQWNAGRACVWLAAVLAIASCGERPDAGDERRIATGIRYLSGDGASAGFASARTPRRFEFPADHGAHPEFRTEWWYFTGNLLGAEARHFGFELTFFRIAVAPEMPASASAWATNQLWMAHFAVTDTAGRQLLAEERFSRGAAGLAGARAEPFEVHVENWSVAGDLGRDGGRLELRAHGGAAALELDLEPQKPVVLHGDRGLDAKGSADGNASYYYSLTRISARGRLRIGQGPWQTVDGLAWMDREWSTSALADGVEGWDWFALQLDDGRDLMFYRLRLPDGSASPFSGGSLVDADGGRQGLDADDVALRPVGDWQSDATGIRYPVEWRIAVPEAGLELELRPVIDAQEIDLSVRYWEGAVQITGSGPDGAVSGRGYLELAGY